MSFNFDSNKVALRKRKITYMFYYIEQL